MKRNLFKSFSSSRTRSPPKPNAAIDCGGSGSDGGVKLYKLPSRREKNCSFDLKGKLLTVPATILLDRLAVFLLPHHKTINRYDSLPWPAQFECSGSTDRLGPSVWKQILATPGPLRPRDGNPGGVLAKVAKYRNGWWLGYSLLIKVLRQDGARGVPRLFFVFRRLSVDLASSTYPGLWLQS